MNRLTRISSILIHLQSKKVVTAQELADRFQVSLRTIYRDIRTLEEAGVPIGSENGLGYFLVKGYSLPPVMLTEEEANALIISEKLIHNQGDTSLIEDFESALIKIKAVLKDVQKEKLQKIDQRIEPSIKRELTKSNWLSEVQKAIINNVIISIEYRSEKAEITNRKVDPLGIYFTDKAWVMIAFCHLRNGLREFRVDRIIDLLPTSETFNNKSDFNLQEYFRNNSHPS